MEVISKTPVADLNFEGLYIEQINCSGFMFSDVPGKPNMTDMDKKAGVVNGLVSTDGTIIEVRECDVLRFGVCVTEGAACPISRAK